MSLLRAITTVGGYTLLSRVLGFLRDILIARYLGAGTISDAFFVAFRFPNLFRRLFAEGAFNAAFVPIYAGQVETEGRESAQTFAHQAFTVLTLVLVVFIAAMEVAMPWAMIVFAPGFESVPGKMELATDLSRAAFPYLLFISLVSLQSGVLNSVGRFAAAASAPILLNLTLIAALLGFANLAETPGHALSWGVSAAGVVQFAWLAWHCRREGVPVRLVRPRLTPRVRLLGKRILPVVLGSSLYQVNLLIGTILASLVSDGAVSWLYYADRVVQLPLGVVGVAVGTALLPLLSRQIKSTDQTAARWSQNRAIEVALLLTLPAAGALMVIAGPIVTVLFEHGRFSAADTDATALAMIAFASGLPAYVLVKVLSPAFYAREDTASPVRIAAGCMVLNMALNGGLMLVIGHVGIALGASLSGWANALALGWLLQRRDQLNLDRRFLGRLPRVLLATGVSMACLWGLSEILAGALAGGVLARSGALAAIVLAGAAVYLILVFVLKAVVLSELKSMFRRAPAPAAAAPTPPAPE